MTDDQPNAEDAAPRHDNGPRRPNHHAPSLPVDPVGLARRLGLEPEGLAPILGLASPEALVRSGSNGSEEASQSNGSTSTPWTAEQLGRLAELEAMADQLAEVVRPGFIPTWLVTPNQTLGDRSPRQALAQGDFEAVRTSIALLGSGEPI